MADRAHNGVSPDWGEAPPGGWVDPISREPVVPPRAGEPISGSEFGYWADLKAGKNPLPGLDPATGGAATIGRPRYRWDLLNAPPPLGPGGELPGRLDMSPLPRVDWATQLSGTTFQYGRTDPDTIHRLLTVYDDDDVPMERAAQFLGLTGEEAKVAAKEANDAVNALGPPYRKTQGEWGAAKSEKNLPTAGGSRTSPPRWARRSTSTARRRWPRPCAWTPTPTWGSG